MKDERWFMMKATITHVAIYATDIEKTRMFYMKYFDAKCNEKYVNQKGFSSYFLTLASGARLEVMANENLEYVMPKELVNGWSHVAFSVGTKENVIELTRQIMEDGYQLVSGPRVTGDGYFESCVLDPDGNKVEITE